MKKLLALLLAAAMCVSMVACGSSAPAETDKTAEPQVEQTANTENEQQEEAETDGEKEFETLFTLTPEKAEEYYQAIISGELQGGGIDALSSMDEYSLKCHLDVLAMIFGEDEFIDILISVNPEELDRIMIEAEGVLNAFLNGGEEDEPSDEGGEQPMEGMPTIMTLYNADIDRRLVVELDPDHAFMEPDWAMLEEEANWFISIDDDYNSYTLYYNTLDIPTEDLIDQWIADDADDGRKTTATEIETFTAGGMEWELFSLVYDRTGTGIDKETGKEVTLTDTVYEIICFTRPDGETALQIDAGTTHNPEFMNHYKEIVQKSIKNITVQ